MVSGHWGGREDLTAMGALADIDGAERGQSPKVAKGREGEIE